MEFFIFLIQEFWNQHNSHSRGKKRISIFVTWKSWDFLQSMGIHSAEMKLRFHMTKVKR